LDRYVLVGLDGRFTPNDLIVGAQAAARCLAVRNNGDVRNFNTPSTDHFSPVNRPALRAKLTGDTDATARRQRGRRLTATFRR
jgi:hypothetical protein